MEQLILIFHVLAAMGIIGLILIQQGKGAEMGASFGAGASQTVFGSSGSGNVLTKSTAILATLFFATSFGLAVVAKNKAVAAGDIDIPVPAAVESRDWPVEPAAPASDVPENIGAPAQGVGADVPAAGMEVEKVEEAENDVQRSDIPRSDIPQ